MYMHAIGLSHKFFTVKYANTDVDKLAKIIYSYTIVRFFEHIRIWPMVLQQSCERGLATWIQLFKTSLA